MAKIPCPRCGKPADGVCAACYLKDHPVKVRKQSFKECECGRAVFKGRQYSDKSLLMDDLAEKSVVAPDGSKITLGDVDFRKEAGLLTLHTRYSLKYKREKVEDDISWDIKVQKYKCEVCTKQGSGYYEAVLQVRDKNLLLDVDPEQTAGIMNAKGGEDIYLISNDYARIKVSELMDKGYLIVSSKKLFTKRNGKDVFRHYYSIKKPPFKAGDFIKVNQRHFQIIEVGRVSKIQDLETKKLKSISVKKLSESEPVASVEDVEKAIVTEVRPDGVQIMSQKDFQTHELKPQEGVRAGDEVEYLTLGKKIYLL